VKSVFGMQRRVSVASFLVFFCVVALVAVAAWTAPVPADAQEPQPDGPVWGEPSIENFDSFDDTRWFKYPLQLSGEKDPRRDPGLVRVEDGLLKLGGGVVPAGNPIGSAIGDKRGQTYGRWEIRFRLDKGTGYGAAVLLWPQSNQWPEDGEIDIIEIPFSQRDRAINALHNQPGDVHLQDTENVIADFSTWHTIAVDWVPGSITFYLDGVKTWVSPNTDLVPASVMRLGMQLDECAPQTYGRWIGCRTECSPDSLDMEVDWVKVYPMVSPPDDPPAPVPPPETVPPAAPEPPCDAPPDDGSPTTTTPGASTPAPPAARPVVANPSFTG